VNIAREMMVLLQAVVQHGTGGAASQLHHAFGGKTGTTNNYTDAWFLGFSPSVTCGTWVGFDDRRSLGEKETGAKAALPIWMEFMKAAVADRPSEQFSRANAPKKALDVAITPPDQQQAAPAPAATDNSDENDDDALKPPPPPPQQAVPPPPPPNDAAPDDEGTAAPAKTPPGAPTSPQRTSSPGTPTSPQRANSPGAAISPQQQAAPIERRPPADGTATQPQDNQQQH
jgi:penicillin-binding protein 1A